MTPFRPFPQDTPKRETTWRRGKIQTRTGSAADGYHYIVNFPDLGTELAFSHQRFEINDVVYPRWRNESSIWWIDGAGRTPLAVIVSTSYPLGGGSAGITGLPFGRYGLRGNNNVPPYDPAYYLDPDPGRVAIMLDLSPTHRWVLQAQAFPVTAPGHPIFAVYPVNAYGFGQPVNSPILNDSNYPALPADQTQTYLGGRAQFSPDGLWILSTMYAPIPQPPGEPPFTGFPAAAAFSWDDTTGAIGPPIEAPAGVIHYTSSVGGGSTVAEWHPSGNYALIGQYYVIEWLGSGWGSVVGRVPGLPLAEAGTAFTLEMRARWSRSGGAYVWWRFEFPPISRLKGGVWTGSGFGAQHPPYENVGFEWGATDIIWSLDNARVAILAQTNFSVDSVLQSWTWDDATGLGTLIDSFVPALTWQTPPSMDLDPTGEWLAFAPGEIGGGLPTRVVNWKADGTFGNDYLRFSDGIGLRGGVQWWPPGISEYPTAPN